MAQEGNSGIFNARFDKLERQVAQLEETTKANTTELEKELKTIKEDQDRIFKSLEELEKETQEADMQVKRIKEEQEMISRNLKEMKASNEELKRDMKEFRGEVKSMGMDLRDIERQIKATAEGVGILAAVFGVKQMVGLKRGVVGGDLDVVEGRGRVAKKHLP